MVPAALGGRLDPFPPVERARSPRRGFALELVEAGISNRCEIDLATGQAALFHGDTALGGPRTD